jgi:hypothetical protein
MIFVTKQVQMAVQMGIFVTKQVQMAVQMGIFVTKQVQQNKCKMAVQMGIFATKQAQNGCADGMASALPKHPAIPTNVQAFSKSHKQEKESVPHLKRKVADAAVPKPGHKTLVHDPSVALDHLDAALCVPGVVGVWYKAS